MTTYQSRVSSLLPGGDPTPGDLDEIRSVTARLRQTVDEVDEVRTVLSGIGSSSDIWAGRAATAFAARHDDLSAKIAAAHHAYSLAADALNRWTARLAEAQSEASALVVHAHQVAQAAGYTSGPPPAALVAVRQQHAALADRARADARRCATDLQAAVGEVGRFAHSWGQWLDEELVKASHFLGDLDDVLAVAGLVAMAAMLFVPGLDVIDVGLLAGLSEALATGALIGGAAKLGVDVTLATRHDGSWGTVAGDAVGIALGGAGKVAGTTLRGAQDAAQLRFAAGRVSATTRSLSRAARSADDPEIAAQLRGAQALSRQQAAEFRAAAKAEEKPLGPGDLIGKTADDTLHPLTFDPEVVEAWSYGHLPPLAAWSRALGEHPVAAVVQGLDTAYDAAEATPGPRDTDETLLDDTATGEMSRP